MPQHALSCWQKHISGYKPAGFGTVVTGLQIIPTRFRIIHIPTVTERLIQAQCSCQGAGRCDNSAPTVVDIFYNGASAVVNKLGGSDSKGCIAFGLPSTDLSGIFLKPLRAWDYPDKLTFTPKAMLAGIMSMSQSYWSLVNISEKYCSTADWCGK